MPYDEIGNEKLVMERIEEKFGEILAKLDTILSLRKQQVDHAPIDPTLIIERYDALGNMLLVANEMGVSPQRVSQIIKKHKESTGGNVLDQVRIATFKQQVRVPRVEWKCQGCGVVVPKTQAALEKSGDLCGKCKRASHGVQVSDETMDEIVADLKTPGYGKLAKWGKTVGYKSNPTLFMAKAVLSFLAKRSRLSDIEEIWPNGVPKYLVYTSVKRRSEEGAQLSEQSKSADDRYEMAG